MQTNSCVAMQQEDVSIPLESSETSETPNSNAEENVEQDVGNDTIPEVDPSTMKEDGSIENEDPSRESPIIEEAEDIDVERNPAEEGESAIRDSSEDLPKVSDLQYCEFQSEAENDKELSDIRNSENNYDPGTENNEEFDEEKIEITVDETTSSNYETNGFIEDVEKDDPAPCSNESLLNNAEGNCFQEENVVEEDAAQAFISNGATAEASVIPNLSLDNHEVAQLNSQESLEEGQCEHQENHENINALSPGNGTWGGKIRSISARRPVRKPSVPPEGSSMRASRSLTPGTITRPGEGSIENDCHSSVAESLFTSLKRKAFDVDSKVTPKKSKVDSSNSTFLSMVSSPLRLLKNKISDRIIESPKVTREGKQVNGNSEDESDEFKAKTSFETKDKNILVPENSTQDSKSYKSWCSVM